MLPLFFGCADVFVPRRIVGGGSRGWDYEAVTCRLIFFWTLQPRQSGHHDGVTVRMKEGCVWTGILCGILCGFLWGFCVVFCLVFWGEEKKLSRFYLFWMVALAHFCIWSECWKPPKSWNPFEAPFFKSYCVRILIFSCTVVCLRANIDTFPGTFLFGIVDSSTPFHCGDFSCAFKPLSRVSSLLDWVSTSVCFSFCEGGGRVVVGMWMAVIELYG